MSLKEQKFYLDIKYDSEITKCDPIDLQQQ